MKRFLLALFVSLSLYSCKKDNTTTPTEPEFFVNEDPATFAEIGSLDIGDVGAPKYLPLTRQQTAFLW